MGLVRLPTARSIQEQIGPLGACITPIDRADSPLLPDVILLLLRIFPAYARYLHLIAYWAENRSFAECGVVSHVWMAQVNGRPAGFRIFDYLPQHNLGFGAFIGVLPEFGGAGLGQWLQAMTLAQVAADAHRLGRPEPHGCVSEIERVGGPDEPGEVTRRRHLAFFQRFGGTVLDVEYLEPPMVAGLEPLCGNALEGITAAPMSLVFYPLRVSDRPSTIDPQFVLDAIYHEYYRVQ